MGAYEGVAREGNTTPIASVPDRPDAPGEFLRDHHADPEPVHQAAVRRQHDPAVDARHRSPLELLQYYPLPNRPGTANNYQGPAPDDDDARPVRLRRVDQNVGNNVRLYVRYNWQDSSTTSLRPRTFRVSRRRQPRVNQNWLVSYTHTLRPNLLNDFRIGYHQHRLRHGELLLR